MMDIYAEVPLLAADLTRDGMSKEAAEILNALQEGSTATEILMMLRHRIQNVRSNNLPLDHEVLRRSKLIIDEIDQMC